MEMVKFYGKLGRHGTYLWRYPDLTTILLEVSGTSFPDLKYTGEGGPSQTNVSFEVAVGQGNEMYVDFADGTGKHTYLPNSSNRILFSAEALHYFQDVPEDIRNTYNPSYPKKRIIRINFKDPSKVTFLRFVGISFHGNFPRGLGAYNISDTLTLSCIGATSRWDTYPRALKGLRCRQLYLTSPFTETMSVLPDWLLNSEIEYINMISTFFAPTHASVNGMDKIHKIKNLRTIMLVSSGLVEESFADNIKGSTITGLVVTHNRFKVVPTNIYNAKQLINLQVGGGLLENWGTGFQVDNKIETLTYSTAHLTIFPTTVPTNINNCIYLKTVQFTGTFRTQERLDAHINAWYDFIVANASTLSGNTKFRQMAFSATYTNSSSSGINTRPSGVYQDSVNPSTPMEKIYKMVKVYGHTWSVVNTTGTGNQVLTP